jgi:hypothetical protein
MHTASKMPVQKVYSVRAVISTNDKSGLIATSVRAKREHFF